MKTSMFGTELFTHTHLYIYICVCVCVCVCVSMYSFGSQVWSDLLCPSFDPRWRTEGDPHFLV